jgi:hypothetical protein
MNATLINFFGIFFLGMKHVLKQVRSELLTSPTCKALGCAKIAESVPASLLLHMHSSSNWTPWHSFEMQSAWAFNTQSPHLLPSYTYPCALMQAFMFKEQVFCSNAYKQALTTKNGKSESSCANEASGHKLRTKLIWPWVLVQNRVWHPIQPLCIFLVPSFGFHPWSSQIWVLVPSFNDFMDNSSALHILKCLVSFFLEIPVGYHGEKMKKDHPFYTI